MKPTLVTSPWGVEPFQSQLFYGQDVRASLRLLPEASIHTVCTSPPYWGLRDYGVDPSVWGGDSGCPHDWGDRIPQNSRHKYTAENSTKEGVVASVGGYPSERGSFCSLCEAWFGQLGLEPTVNLFVDHLVEVFQEVARVLRPDGTLWLNLGDSFNNYRVGNDRGMIGQRLHGREVRDKPSVEQGVARRATRQENLKEKDLVGVPWAVAFAMRDAGWYLRSACPWVKRTAMPESVHDRPTSALEYIFLFAHPNGGGKYFYDQVGTRVGVATPGRSSGNVERKVATEGERDRTNTHLGSSIPWTDTGVGRNRRNTDWFFESLQDAQKNQGMLQNDEGDPLGFLVNPKPYPGAHFATWPETLVEPMIKAGSSEHGCCSACGAPYERRVEIVGEQHLKWSKADNTAEARLSVTGGGTDPGIRAGIVKVKETVGWRSTCECNAPIQPCSVLDPFSGSATTGAVAMRLGRNYVGTDVQDKYLPLAVARLEGRAAPKEDTESNPIDDLFG